MNTTKASWFLAFCLLAFVGCGKKQPVEQPPVDIGGVKVDMPKLQMAFSNGPEDALGDVHQAVAMIRYGKYDNSLVALDKLSNNPALNEQQKKIVNDVIEQMKQVIAKVGTTRQ